MNVIGQIADRLQTVGQLIFAPLTSNVRWAPVIAARIANPPRSNYGIDNRHVMKEHRNAGEDRLARQHKRFPAPDRSRVVGDPEVKLDDD